MQVLKTFITTVALAIAAAAAAETAPPGPTIFHTVRFHLRDDADQAEVARVMGMMDELGHKLGFINDFVVGRDLSEGYDIGATYVIHGYDDFRAYLYDPLHLEIDKAGLPLVASMESFDITDAPNKAEAAATIAQIHKDRIRDVPGLAELLRQMQSYSGPGN